MNHGDIKENVSGWFFLNTVYISYKQQTFSVIDAAIAASVMWPTTCDILRYTTLHHRERTNHLNLVNMRLL